MLFVLSYKIQLNIFPHESSPAFLIYCGSRCSHMLQINSQFVQNSSKTDIFNLIIIMTRKSLEKNGRQNWHPKYGNLRRLPRAFDLQKYVSKSISAQQVMEMKKAFDLFDRYPDGFITVQDLRLTVNQLGLGFQAHHIYRFIEPYDPDKPTKIDFDEFFKIFAMDRCQFPDRLDTDRIFSMFDHERTGLLNLKDLKKSSKQLGFCDSKQKLQEMIAVLDLDGDGYISQDDFYQKLAKPKWGL